MVNTFLQSFENVQSAPRQIKFTVKSSHSYVVNALRRVMLSELYSPGIPNHYSSDGKSGIHVIKNTGRLHNEFLSHRLSMLPLALEPSKIQQERFMLSVKKTCAASEINPMALTSNDILLYRWNKQEYELVEDEQPYLIQGATQLIPTDLKVEELLGDDEKVSRGILITRLYPDEELHVQMYPNVYRTCDFAGCSPLYTCTYEQADTKDALTNDFHFSLQSLGTFDCSSLVHNGLQILQQKVELMHHMFQKNTVELSFRSSFSSLQSIVSSENNKCWVRWSNVDFLTSLRESESFYQKHCREVLVASGNDDMPLVLKPYSKQAPVPAVDGEDVHTSSEKVKLIFAMHQPTFASNGLYEYNTSKRQYESVTEPHATYTILKEGREQRAMVYTPATIVQMHDDRCVLQFGADVSEKVFDHLIHHIDGIVCAGSADGAPPVHLSKPRVARDARNCQMSNDNKPSPRNVDEEDHTLGNLIQGHIYDKLLRENTKRNSKHHLIALGYNKPLPSEKRVKFRFEFDTSMNEKSFKTFLEDELMDVEKNVESMIQMWETVSN